jgi:hypothetical protein
MSEAAILIAADNLATEDHEPASNNADASTEPTVAVPSSTYDELCLPFSPRQKN